MSNEEKSLPNDLIIEILSWLPPETLMKFKTVSTSWYSTINDAKFIFKHRSHFGNNNNNVNNGRFVITKEKYTRSFEYLEICLVQDTTDPAPGIVQRSSNMEFEIPLDLDHPYHYHIMGSCNGLLYYATYCVDHAPIQLCNPSTRWSYLVPSYRLGNAENVPSLFWYGVGFDKFVNDYKVIKFLCGRGCIGSAIYSIKTKSWKPINVQIPPNIVIWSRTSIFLEGFIHWIVYKNNTSSERTSLERTVMLFDVCNEVIREMQLPEFEEGCNKDDIYVVKGSLSFLVANGLRKNNNAICHIWTMKEYGVTESWNKQFVVELDQDFIRKSIGILSLTFDGKILFSTSDIDNDTQDLFLHDIKTGRYKYLDRISKGSNLYSLVANL